MIVQLDVITANTTISYICTNTITLSTTKHYHSK